MKKVLGLMLVFGAVGAGNASAELGDYCSPRCLSGEDCSSCVSALCTDDQIQQCTMSSLGACDSRKEYIKAQCEDLTNFDMGAVVGLNTATLAGNATTTITSGIALLAKNKNIDDLRAENDKHLSGIVKTDSDGFPGEAVATGDPDIEAIKGDYMKLQVEVWTLGKQNEILDEILANRGSVSTPTTDDIKQQILNALNGVTANIWDGFDEFKAALDDYKAKLAASSDVTADLADATSELAVAKATLQAREANEEKDIFTLTFDPTSNAVTVGLAGTISDENVMKIAQSLKISTGPVVSDSEKLENLIDLIDDKEYAGKKASEYGLPQLEGKDLAEYEALSDDDIDDYQTDIAERLAVINGDGTTENPGELSKYKAAVDNYRGDDKLQAEADKNKKTRLGLEIGALAGGAVATTTSSIAQHKLKKLKEAIEKCKNAFNATPDIYSK